EEHAEQAYECSRLAKEPYTGEDGSYRADCDAQKRQTCSHGRNSCDTGPQASEAFCVFEAHGPYDFEDASGEKDDPGHSVTYPGGTQSNFLGRRSESVPCSCFGPCNRRQPERTS